MHLLDLHIENVKLLRNMKLSFGEQGKPRMWTVLLGENGLCKTTILQAIAMAANGYVRANQLGVVPSLTDRRDSSRNAKIAADFGFSQRFHESREYPWMKEQGDVSPMVHSEITVAARHRTAKGKAHYFHDPSSPNDPLDDVRARNVPHWFVCGYGTSRMLPRSFSSERSEDPVLQRLDALFDRGSLIATGFADILDDSQAFAVQLRKALIRSGLLPGVTNLELRGSGGIRSAADLIDAQRFEIDVGGGATMKVPATWLSQGYQSTIAWIADMLGQVFIEAGRAVALEEMEGIVLIDEIDLHLHPRWQVDLVPTLKRVFPYMQFIVTTHSPMILPGLEQEEVFILTKDSNGDIVAKQAPESPALLTGSQIYNTFFGIDRLYPNDLGHKLQRYGFLVGTPARSDEEEAELKVLRDALAARGVDPGWEAVPRADAQS